MQSIASSLLIGLIFWQLERNMSSLSPRLFSSFLLVFAQLLSRMLHPVTCTRFQTMILEVRWRDTTQLAFKRVSNYSVGFASSYLLGCCNVNTPFGHVAMFCQYIGIIFLHCVPHVPPLREWTDWGSCLLYWVWSTHSLPSAPSSYARHKTNFTIQRHFILQRSSLILIFGLDIVLDLSWFYFVGWWCWSLDDDV